MTADNNAICQTWYESSYGHAGFSAQRRYPNEELLRFFGRHYFALSPERRRELRVLEVGCGSGANLWMMAREGFGAHGIDLSPEGIALCAKMLQAWGAKAELRAADMTALSYPDRYFDVIADVFSSYCLDETGFARFLDEVVRLLRPGGRFFSYTPSKASDAFKNPGPSKKLDASTLDGIRRKDSPFAGNLYPFRFIAGADYAKALESRRLRVTYNETVGRSYRNGAEYFEFVVIAGEKPAA
jgi:SAM-dependent methyltransferase